MPKEHTMIAEDTTSSYKRLFIQTAAHLIWIDEGCPNGKSEIHWEVASRLADLAEQKAMESDLPHKWSFYHLFRDASFCTFGFLVEYPELLKNVNLHHPPLKDTP